MQLGKDEVQKIILGSLILIGVVYAYFSLLLGPLQTSQRRIETATADMTRKVSEAQAQIKRTQNIEASAPTATLTRKQIMALIPEDSPLAWYPTRVADLFKQAGVDKAATRMNSETQEKELSGLRKISWGVEVPAAKFSPLAHALEGLENEEMLSEIVGLQIESIKDDPDLLKVAVTINSLVKQ